MYHHSTNAQVLRSPFGAYKREDKACLYCIYRVFVGMSSCGFGIGQHLQDYFSFYNLGNAHLVFLKIKFSLHLLPSFSTRSFEDVCGSSTPSICNPQLPLGRCHKNPPRTTDRHSCVFCLLALI